jgi:hypothetical protein
VLVCNALGPVFALVAHAIASRGTIGDDEAARPSSSGNPAQQH